MSIKRFVNRWYWHIVIVMLGILAVSYLIAWYTDKQLPSIAMLVPIGVLLGIRMNQERKQ